MLRRPREQTLGHEIKHGGFGVFVSDMRSRQVRDLKLFAQAVTLIAVFYDGLVVPGRSFCPPVARG
jgi:hypothetical protein